MRRPRHAERAVRWSLVLGVALAGGAALGQQQVHRALVPSPVKSEAVLLTAPQLGYLGLTARWAALPHISLTMGAWNLVPGDREELLARGGWVGAHGLLFDGRNFKATLAVRFYLTQAKDHADPLPGVEGLADVRLRFLGATMRPEVSVLHLPDYDAARLTEELRYALGEWHVTGRGGVQLTYPGGDSYALPFALVAVGWGHDFETVHFELEAQVAATTDPATLLGHPLRLKPDDVARPYAGLSVTIGPLAEER